MAAELHLDALAGLLLATHLSVIVAAYVLVMFLPRGCPQIDMLWSRPSHVISRDCYGIATSLRHCVMACDLLRIRVKIDLLQHQ